MIQWLGLKLGSRSNPTQGVHVDVVMSPYDLPDAVRAMRTPRGRFRIEFRYVDGVEPASAEKMIDRHASVFEGRHSGRLLALELDVEALGAKAVGLSITPDGTAAARVKENIDSAWRQWSSQRHSAEERVRLDGARAALRAREDDLITQYDGR